MSDILKKTIKDLEWILDYHKNKVLETEELLRVFRKEETSDAQSKSPCSKD